jgi:hypothetical protein
MKKAKSNEPVFWFRAWLNEDGSLQICRTGYVTRKDLIEDAENQFGETWETMYCGRSKKVGCGTIRAIKCRIIPC